MGQRSTGEKALKRTWSDEILEVSEVTIHQNNCEGCFISGKF